MHPRISPIRAHGALCLVLALGACTDARLVGPVPNVRFDVTFAVDAALEGHFDPGVIDRLRFLARDAGTAEVLVSGQSAWDPAQDVWTVELDMSPGEAGNREVVFEIELSGDGVVEWSSRTEPWSVQGSEGPVDVSVILYRGPLANLAVTAVELSAAPTQVDESTSVEIEAVVTASDPASLPEIRLFWSSSDPAVASVDADGVLSALAPGTVQLFAVAGPTGDTTAIEVLVVPTGVLLDPPDARLTSLTEEVTLTGAVVDARGDTLSGFALSWASSDSTVLMPLGSGVFRAITGGTADAVAAVVGAEGAEGRAAIEVSQEVASAALDADTVLFAALGGEVTLSLTAEDAEGVAVAAPVVTWTSSDEAVATVSADGVVTAVGNGRADIDVRVSAPSAGAAQRGPGRMPAAAPGMDTVLVSAVVDVAQVATSVTVSPADSVILGPGSTIQFVAEVVDANGHEVVGVPTTWQSSDGAVATIDASGLVSSQGAGVTSISVEADGLAASTDLTVLTTGGFSAVWVGGDPAGARDWDRPDNWLPRRLPAITDTVLIQASASDQPRLTGNADVGDLVLEDGARLDLEGFTLAVFGDLDAGTTVVGPGSVRMAAATARIRGGVPTLVLDGVVDVDGALTVSGDLLVIGADAALEVGGSTVSVSGAFRTLDGATLVMTDPSGVLDVDGEAVFDGASTDGLLTAGVLRVGGNFTSWTSGAANFAPTDTHRTVLDGGVVQVVYLHFNGPGQARFNDLEVDNPGGVQVQSTVRITNDVVLTNGDLSGDQTAVIGGDVTEAGGGNQYRVLNTTFTGSPTLPPSIQTNVTFATAFTTAADLAIVGDLVASGGGAGFEIGAHAVTVSGLLRIEDGATLTMRDAAGSLAVAGEAFFNGGPTLGLLTAGELRVGGNFTAWTSDVLNFAPTGSHRTLLDGAAAQSVYLQYTGADESRFQVLEIDNASGVSLLSTTRVTDDLLLTSGTLDGSQTVFVSGDLTEVVGGNQHRVLNTTFTGSPTLPSSVQSNLTFTAAYTLTRDLAVIGNVTVGGAAGSLDVGSNTLDVSGDFRTADAGTLTMQDPAGVVDVEGEAEFNGGSTSGLLTAGELRIAGNFTAWTSNALNFAPGGDHTTSLDGSAAQTVYLFYSGANQGRFEDLLISNAAGVTFLGTTRVTDELTVSTALDVSDGQSTLVSGLFTLESAATLTNDGSVQANSCTILGTVVGNPPVCS